MQDKRIICIAGPTAVGKTDVACSLARELGGEIVSCDAMQVYREISIVNNKPPAAMLAAVPHHLIGIVSLQEEFDAASFYQKARTAIEDIFSRGRRPIVCGGSGLYMEVLLDGIFSGGGKDLKVRRQLEERAKREGLEVLFRELKEADGQAADRIHHHDARRIIRALEVYQVTREPISRLQKVREGLWGQYDISAFVLNRERPELYSRINERVEEMVAQGLVDEIAKLDGLSLSRTAAQIIGLKEIAGFRRGDYSLGDAKEQMKFNTRHLAKRQLTWFRKDKRLQWISITAGDSAGQIGENILCRMKYSVEAERHMEIPT